jgi:hypothetical protein
MLALDLIGQVYRSNDGRRPADAISKLKAQLAGAENLTVEDWVSGLLAETGAVIPQPQNPALEDLQAVLQSLEVAAEDRSTEKAFRKLDSLTLTADSWKKLARLATGRSVRSAKAAKVELRTYLANQVQLHNRRESIAKLFP